jgi:hypothetical protein
MYAGGREKLVAISFTTPIWISVAFSRANSNPCWARRTEARHRKSGIDPSIKPAISIKSININLKNRYTRSYSCKVERKRTVDHAYRVVLRHSETCSQPITKDYQELRVWYVPSVRNQIMDLGMARGGGSL